MQDAAAIVRYQNVSKYYGATDHIAIALRWFTNPRFQIIHDVDYPGEVEELDQVHVRIGPTQTKYK